MALTKYNYNSFDITPVASKTLAFNSDADGFTTVTEGSMVLIKTLTASSSANLSFVDGTSDVVLDNTYPIYKFVFVNMHPATDSAQFQFNMSVDTGSNYNVAKTTTLFKSRLYEDHTGAELGYETGSDLAQGTGAQPFTYAGIPNANDSSLSGILTIFNPSSTTFVKHFISKCQYMGNEAANPVSYNSFIAGYANSTSAVDAIQFSISSGNIDAGTIKLYGIKDS